MKFNLFTIPHSGTRFLINIFERCGYVINTNLPVSERTPNSDFYLFHFHGETIERRNRVPNICSLQHPIRVAVSWIIRYQTTRMHDYVKSWDNYIKFVAKYPVTFVDINCAPSKRYDHLVSVFEQTNLLTEDMLPILKDAADNWEPIGGINHPIKTAYLQDGTLPKYNWDRFNRYIKWYEQQRDNIAS